MVLAGVGTEEQAELREQSRSLPERASEPQQTGSDDGVPAVQRRSPQPLFALCLLTIAKRLKSFINTRLYPPAAPLLAKPFEQALTPYDLAPLALLDDQRCFERIRSAKATKLQAMRSKVTAPYEQHRVEEVPPLALCANLDDDLFNPLKAILGILSPPDYRLREPSKNESLRKLEAEWDSMLENRPPENVEPEDDDVLLANGGKRPIPEKIRLVRQTVTNVGCGLVAELLVSNSRLIELSLQNCQITCAGAIVLANALKISSSLRSFDLSNSDSKAYRGHVFDNDIREGGSTAIALALQTNRSAVSVSLGCNHVGIRGAQALARMLSTNSTLRQLDLNTTAIGEAAEELIEAFHLSNTLVTLKLEWCGLRSGLGTQLASIQAAKATKVTQPAHQLSSKPSAI